MSASSFQRNVQFVTVSYYCADLNCCIDDLFEIGHSPLVDQTSLSLLDVFCLGFSSSQHRPGSSGVIAVYLSFSSVFV